MADIKINDIKLNVAELFLDSESFLNELSNDELNLRGGMQIASTKSYYCGTVTTNEFSTDSVGCRTNPVAK
ncbi:hypothetical protein [Calothrix sp. NIES-2098]|uniref:hypothetical protein n=1 Tax=Calothrix sp. NIES-2098 TaxID=1954171 RepID=UPI000B5FBC89|nr:hypothetical protein NIES2098_40790 [Calothrix sp. NIES-2098]